MQLDFFPFSKVDQLSKRDISFQTEPDKYKDFLELPFSLEAFEKKIDQRKQFPVDRKTLVEVIKEQYKKAGIDHPPTDNIELLKKEDTFTVITAHQPSLLTGPLYYIYKIVSVINLAEKLNQTYKENIIPVFIIGSEDHDFEEVNHLNLFGKEIVWENEQGGAVGRMDTKSLDPVLERVYEILGSSNFADELRKIISTSFDGIENYNQAVFRMVHQLFKSYDLVLIVTDHKMLKSQFIPFIKREIFERPSQDLIVATQNKLEALDLKGQAHARAINFFYLQEGRRDRIELEGDKFVVLDTDLTFTEDELREEIENHPERFSPNVVMRPVYQEVILPNLAYLGGGGEIAYWTERKSQFEAFNVSFPILVRRNSVLWIGKGEQKQMEKYGIGLNELFLTEDDWIRSFVKANASAELEFSEEFSHFQKAYDLLSSKAKPIDPNLAKSIEASGVKAFKSFEQLSSRLIRTEKDRHENDLNKIRKLHDKIFPSGGLQERKDNFIPYYLKHGGEFIKSLKSALDPFNPNFVVIREE
ncbi:bacillithiol biosynthesis cysteine-adding enzyme BshC [Portibacter marinus]|uniref:bacillithiol biosynthesis cysteine-adding enzyme BshC n=1 Tax=Portibacter marinus TaxID=2898660 RepID=UPI001F1CB4D1|nr:bacillithiol biosynthesis cysteine-adding enzyme BshC [Portibacter marinus]